MSKKGENNETLLPIPFLDGGKESGASIRRAKKLDMYSDSKVKNEGLMLSTIGTRMTLFFWRGLDSKNILRSFELISDLLVNFVKSCVMGELM
jgi:hypothetical protein